LAAADAGDDFYNDPCSSSFLGVVGPVEIWMTNDFTEISFLAAFENVFVAHFTVVLTFLVFLGTFALSFF